MLNPASPYVLIEISPRSLAMELIPIIMLLAMPFVFIAVKLHDRQLQKHLSDLEGYFEASRIKNRLLDMMIHQNHRGRSMILDDLCDRDRSDWDYACAVLDDYRTLHPRQ